MKTGNNISLRKRAKGIEKLYSKPWSRFRIPEKWFQKRKIEMRGRNVTLDE